MKQEKTKPQNKLEKSAGAIIYFFEKEPKFLLLKYPTYWGFTKGIIEKQEKIEETIKREIKEETGIENFQIVPGFKHEQKWFFKAQGNLVFKEAIFLLVKVSREEAEKVKISFEHEDFAWLSLEEALEKMKIKNNKEMLEKAEKFILEFERQKTLT